MITFCTIFFWQALSIMPKSTSWGTKLELKNGVFSALCKRGLETIKNAPFPKSYLLSCFGSLFPPDFEKDEEKDGLKSKILFLSHFFSGRMKGARKTFFLEH